MRTATERDLPAIIAMLADDPLGQSREDTSHPPASAYTSAFHAIECDPNQHLVVADDEGAVMGCLQLTYIPGLSRQGMWRGQIESVRVAADYRGRRLGREMMLWAIEQCRVRGCELVQLSSDKTRVDALRFYGALGFEASHEGLKLRLAIEAPDN